MERLLINVNASDASSMDTFVAGVFAFMDLYFEKKDDEGKLAYLAEIETEFFHAMLAGLLRSIVFTEEPKIYLFTDETEKVFNPESYFAFSQLNPGIDPYAEEN